ncbi:MAG: hypothetical protein R6V55_13630 [Desulfovermiculus sp.]
MGGLARRASVLQKWQEKHNAVAVAGGYELSRPEHQALQTALRIFPDAFGKLGYDIGALSRAEAQQLHAAYPEGNVLPSGWMTFSSQPQTAVFTHQGLRLGFILLPETEASPSGTDHPDQSIEFTEISNSLQNLKETCDLTIGLSPWGWKQEKHFLASKASRPDILLGSGPGAAVQGKLSADGRTLWIRPYSRGRALSVLTIYDPQEKGWKDGWKINTNVRHQFQVLDQKVPTDPHMENQLNSVLR